MSYVASTTHQLQPNLTYIGIQLLTSNHRSLQGGAISCLLPTPTPKSYSMFLTWRNHASWRHGTKYEQCVGSCVAQSTQLRFSQNSWAH